MRKIFLLPLLLVLSFFATSFKSPDGDWKEYKPEGSRCKVLMAGTPTRTERVVNTALGELKLTVLMYQPPKDGNDDNVLYGVSYSDYPAEHVHSDSINSLKEFFDRSITGSINAIQGKKLTETIINYKGYPGREVRVDFKNGMAIIKYRFYLVKNRLYTMQVITLTQKNFNKDINKYLDSFELLG